MTIAYETNENDVAAWSVHRIFSDPQHVRRLRAQRVAVAFLSAISFCFFLIAVLPDSSLFIAPLLSSFVAVLAYVARERTEKREIAAKTKRYVHQGGLKVALGQREVTVRPNGLHIASPEFESLLKWPSIKQIRKTEAHLFIHWSENEIFAIPRRAFADEMHEALFFSEIERYRGVSHRENLSVPVAPVSAAPVSVASAPTNGGAWYHSRAGVDTGQESVLLKRGD